ncbi:MAG: cupin domain-containing protein [Candidatus Rariloculaceae bacterium]
MARAIMMMFATMVAMAAFAQDMLSPVALAPSDLEWDTARSNHRATISGSNETPGMYVYRTRFPDGFRNQPHYHPDSRVGTVISGTLHVGFGGEIDEASMRPITAGGMWTEPAGQAHYVWVKDGPVEIQIVGEGPSGTTQVER